MRVQHNIAAMNAYRNFGVNNKGLNKNLEKLSSGYKINRAGDDAAGLGISEKMRAQITAIDGAQKNVKDGISLIQTAEGALSEVHDMLNRMYSLAEQSANGTYEQKDRDSMQLEVDALKKEINRIGDTAEFNGTLLFSGTSNLLSGSTKLAIGDIGGVGGDKNMMTLEFKSVKVEDASETLKTLNTDNLGLGKEDTYAADGTVTHNASTKSGFTGNVVVDDAGDAQTSMGLVKNAINAVSALRGQLGAYQNRLEHTNNNLGVMKENLQDAESTIRDTDVAEEMMKYTKNNIMNQAAQAMLAQSNQQPQGVLQLLQ